MIAALLFIATLLIYLLSNFGRDTPYNYFIYLANAFLHGRLYVTENYSWLNELINWQGRYYVVYPPMPAILLMPFVAVFGTGFHQPLLAIILGASNVALSYLVFVKIFKDKKVSFLTSFLYAFGTIQWYHAEVGSAWYLAIVEGMFFTWLALLESVTKKRLFLVGLFVGLAYLSRLPTILVLIFPLIFFYDKFLYFQNGRLWRLQIKNIFLLVAGVSIPVVFNFAYNFVRYGVINDISYQLLPVFNEPWYRYGLFNVRYIPTHFWEMLTALPKFSLKPPFVIPSMYVMSIFFTTPAFIFSFFATFKNRICIAALAALVSIGIVELSHGAVGFTQFGYRYLMDFYPFLLILTASGMRHIPRFAIIILLIMSIAVNLWGVIMLSFFDIWTW